jgi:cytochrome P450
MNFAGSDVIHLKILGTDVIVVNSAEASKELFEKKSALYTDRPRMTMINDIVGLGWHFGFMPHGDEWREHRKLFNHDFNPTSALKYHPMERKWTITFLKNLLDTPQDFLEHVQHMVSGTVLELTHGLTVQPAGKPDPFIGAAKGALTGLGTAGLFGTYIVDYLPSLRYLPSWFPGAGFKREAAGWRANADVAIAVPFDVVKGAIANGTAASSFAKGMTERYGSQSERAHEEKVARQTSAAMFASGSAGTVAALQSFFLAMAIYPEAQAKAQAELDRVLGGRLPEFSDETSLPYITALIREVLRWAPVVPLAFPHRLTSDDTYKGYHLPAGAVVLPNAWAILNDPITYPSPESFKPERFLNADGSLNSQFPDAAFGFARRSCPGRYIALPSMFIAVAATLSTFDIKKKGNVTKSHTQGLLSYPLPFTCEISPRSKAVEALVRAAV